MTRYLAKTSCCRTTVAVEVDETTPTEKPAIPSVTSTERRAIRRGEVDDPREAWIADNNPTVWRTSDRRDGHEVAHAYLSCPGCGKANRIITSDGVRGEVNDAPCSHSCIRAASVECFCSCGGSNHGSLHVAN